MENLLALTLIARNAERNHHRHYTVTVGRDLLNDWTVAIRFGRIGQAGQERCYADPDPSVMAAVIRERLQRRVSAPTRIGCAYRLVECSAAPGFEAAPWLPDDVLARLNEVSAGISR